VGAPCAQVHIPSIYPTGSCTWEWESGRFKAYVDGETVASIDLALREVPCLPRVPCVPCRVFLPADHSPQPAMVPPAALCGAVVAWVYCCACVARGAR
jgi:hypothetical protein